MHLLGGGSSLLTRQGEVLPAEARRLTRTEAPSLIERNRALHRMLVNGFTVEYRRPDVVF